MARLRPNLLDVAESALANQDARLESLRAEQMAAVLVQSASGNGDMDAAFSLDRRFRLVFIRAHYSGSTGTAPLVMALDSGLGTPFDARLFTIHRAGVGHDVHLRIPAAERIDPSPWTFQPGDQVNLSWTNPAAGAMIWGLTIGLANAP